MISVGVFLLIVVGGLGIAGGQACMSIFARGIPHNASAPSVIVYSLTSLPFYGFIVLYGIATVAMVYLMRSHPLAQVSISVLGVTFLANVGFTFLLRQPLSAMQLIGIAVVFAGIVLLQFGK